MKKGFLIVILILRIIDTWAQDRSLVWNGQVVSKQEKGIEFVNVQIKSGSTRYLFTTDEQGYLSILYNNVSIEDSVSITCIGYKTQKISCNTLNTLKQIKLEEDVYLIGEVVVTPQKVKLVKFGNLRNFTFRSSQISFDNQSAIYIPNTGIDGKIMSVRVYMIDYASHDWKYRPFRVRLYDGTQIVGKELIKEEVIASLKPNKNHWVDIDISQLDLSFPKSGVVVAIQALSKEYYLKNGYIKSETIRSHGKDRINSISIGWASDGGSDSKLQSWMYINKVTGWTQKYNFDEKGNFLIQITVKPNN